ncbi:TonB-linked outer membrane protein, SusC/RagA family [Filimonas lacunae]|uniref:TonB-linked outer membrane protein, SusC/RagA family n=1 Tax=Filimonas lacunae TaxID=477680 RepID=A0A173MH08_9BACT|nr:SusC/RagA family TonB-linked outer membrane protein [Filimonas lacunae]BAV06770.1 outer membrane protein SusC, starch binding [Filimonas lacunae]SIT34388.1 TonB-linked outer membrane protein, SusC/RagA family [Filimonas lacunae]
MNKKDLLTLLLSVLFCTVAVAQNVTGKVTDSSGKAVAAATVAVKGSNKKVTTNEEGRFTIAASGKDVLQISFVGFATQEVALNGRTTLSVSLQQEVADNLDNVIVVALGMKRQAKKLGYSAETVKVDEMKQNRTTNVMGALEGKVAGLDISPPTAGTGASTKIRLRGQSAFAGATNSPLIVINGLPMDQGARGADGNNSIDLGDNMQQINPDDIESMTVLKGATAAALYGSRAANGAIIITTKNGSKAKGLGVEYNLNYSADQVLDFTDFQYEYGQGQGGKKPTTQGEAITTGQFGWGAKYDGVPTVQFDGVARPYVAHRNRIKEFYRTGRSVINTVALSGGNGQSSFRASYSNQNVQGISPNNDYKKRIFNLGVNHKLSNQLSLQVNINYTNEVNNNPPQVGAQGDGAPNFLYRMSNSIGLDVLKEKAVTPTGTETQTSGFQTTLINPYFLMPRQFIINKRDRILGTATLRYDITKWLYAQGRVNMDYGVNLLERNRPTGTGSSTPLNSAGTGFNGTYSIAQGTARQMNSDFLIGANHAFKDFTVDLSAGGNIYTVLNRNSVLSVVDFIVRDLYSFENGLTKSDPDNLTRHDYYREQVNSLYAFAELGYKNMLFLNITGRNDWFTVLNPKNNSYFYPSFSGSFVFSELTKNLPWLNYGKLRASYASVGSANGIGAFTGLLTYGILPNTFNGLSLGNIPGANSPNPLLKPFSVREKEIGLELKMFNNRVNLDVAAYDKQTRDQIITVAISNASGYDGTPLNLGSLQNRGLEFMLELVPIRHKNFSWSSSFNTAINSTKVLALAPGQQRQVVTTFSGNEFIGSLVYEVGKPLNQLAAKTYLRNDKGQIVLNSTGGLQANTGADVLFGSALPKATGGWNNTFRYKNLSLLVHIDYKAGGKILSSTALNGLRQGHTKASLVGREGGVVFNGVQADGTNNNKAVDPQTFYTQYRNQQIADPFVFKSDFIKLRNITLSYDLTRVVGDKVKFVKGLILSATCRNVAIIKKYLPDLDPEAFASSGDNRVGYEQTTLPTTRNYGINLNVKF